MFYPHPVLTFEKNAYDENSRYELAVSARTNSEGNVKLELIHNVDGCPDLVSLVAEGKAVFSCEIKGKSKFLHIESSKAIQQAVDIPKWALHCGPFEIVGRIIARTDFEFRPKNVTEDYQGIGFEMMPGTLMAITGEYKCEIYEDFGKDLFQIAKSHNNDTALDLLTDTIVLKVPDEAYDKIAVLNPVIRSSDPGLAMLQFAAFIEAMAKIRYCEDEFDADWKNSIEKLARNKGILDQLQDENGPSLMGLAEILFDGPIEEIITKVHSGFVNGSGEED